MANLNKTRSNHETSRTTALASFIKLTCSLLEVPFDFLVAYFAFFSQASFFSFHASHSTILYDFDEAFDKLDPDFFDLLLLH